MNEETALAAKPKMHLEKEMALFDYDFRLSKALSASQMTGVFKTPEQVFTAIQMGRGHGWSPMQSLHNLYPLHNTVHLTAIAAMGLVLPHADKPPTIKRESKNGQAYSCTVTYLRDGVESSRTFTLDQAKAAGLVKGGGAWTAYAENMLYWRAGMFAAREAFPDILAGIYSIEEMANKTVEELKTKDITPEGSGTDLEKRLETAAEEVKLMMDEEKKQEETNGSESEVKHLVQAAEEIVTKDVETKSGTVPFEVGESPKEIAKNKIGNYTRKRDLEAYLKAGEKLKWPAIMSEADVKDLVQFGKEKLKTFEHGEGPK